MEDWGEEIFPEGAPASYAIYSPTRRIFSSTLAAPLILAVDPRAL